MSQRGDICINDSASTVVLPPFRFTLEYRTRHYKRFCGGSCDCCECGKEWEAHSFTLFPAATSTTSTTATRGVVNNATPTATTTAPVSTTTSSREQQQQHLLLPDGCAWPVAATTEDALDIPVGFQYPFGGPDFEKRKMNVAVLQQAVTNCLKYLVEEQEQKEKETEEVLTDVAEKEKGDDQGKPTAKSATPNTLCPTTTGDVIELYFGSFARRQWERWPAISIVEGKPTISHRT